MLQLKARKVKSTSFLIQAQSPPAFTSALIILEENHGNFSSTPSPRGLNSSLAFDGSQSKRENTLNSKQWRWTKHFAIYPKISWQLTDNKKTRCALRFPKAYRYRHKVDSLFKNIFLRAWIKPFVEENLVNAKYIMEITVNVTKLNIKKYYLISNVLSVFLFTILVK